MNDKILKLEECKLISREIIGKDQVDKNLKRAFQDIVVARANVEIDREASYNYSYLAMLRAGRALMFFYGYRPFGTNQHKTVVSFAEIILGKDSTNLIFKFDKMRKFRNKFTLLQGWPIGGFQLGFVLAKATTFIFTFFGLSGSNS
ncbi:MAG: Uncharacterized protein XD85_0543 [Parcubacteria bacterium 34_609]|nr:MAG: Uncharacterized protein XD85_0543 [Parcubacteria bacterium 34_609]